MNRERRVARITPMKDVSQLSKTEFSQYLAKHGLPYDTVIISCPSLSEVPTKLIEELERLKDKRGDNDNSNDRCT